MILGNILDDAAVQAEVGEERYDLAVSNILAPVIVLLTGELARHLKPGAVWISSGIVQEREQEVVEAVKACPDWELLEVIRQGEWVSVTARKR